VTNTFSTTREQIIEATAAAFATPPASVIDLLDAALAVHASPATIDAIKTLPVGRRFNHIRDLWTHLPDIPVSA
jgi:hypothetical protein